MACVESSCIRSIGCCKQMEEMQGTGAWCFGCAGWIDVQISFSPSSKDNATLFSIAINQWEHVRAFEPPILNFGQLVGLT